MVSTTFVPQTDQHLAASLRVGELAGKLYPLAKTAAIAQFPEAIQADLAEAHAALNRAALALIEIAIAKDAAGQAIEHYTDLAAQAQGGAA